MINGFLILSIALLFLLPQALVLNNLLILDKNPRYQTMATGLYQGILALIWVLLTWSFHL